MHHIYYLQQASGESENNKFCLLAVWCVYPTPLSVLQHSSEPEHTNITSHSSLNQMSFLTVH